MSAGETTLFSNIVRGYLWIILLLAVVSPIILLSTVDSSLRDRADEDLIRTAQALVPSVEPYLTDQDYSGLDALVDSIAPAMDTRITVIARDGTVFADSEEDPGQMENHRTRTEVIAAFNGLPGSSSRRSATLGREMLYCAVPVFSGDSITAVVRTSFFFDSHAATVQPVLARLLLIAAAALLTALISALVITRRISVPMRDLADVAERVTGGDLGARAAPGNTREQNSLARSINETLARNESLIGDLSRSVSRNRAILHSMSEGVLVVSEAGAPVLVNQSFRDLFKLMDPRGEEVPQEVRELILRNTGISSRGKMRYQGRVISWASAGVEDSGDSVFSFTDITKEHQLTEIKRNFAINVSHELRTPLTAIKGYAETLREDAAGDSLNYLEIILRNTDRLIALVKDIQILSEVEGGTGAFSMERVPVQSVLDTVIPLFESRAHAKGLKLDCVVEKPGLVLQADRYRVEQVLVNLVDNAVKYSDEGGVEVRISSRGGLAVFAVSDSGRGIPWDQQERIFERFYTVDRSRSRKLGGTGLGLAISKHIVEAHGGLISVNSSPGQGSIFIFTIPLEP